MMTVDVGVAGSIEKPYNYAAAPWEGNSIPLKTTLVPAVNNWPELTAQQCCPIAFSEAEVEDTMRKLAEQEHMDLNMNILRDVLEIGLDGSVSHERYQAAVAAAQAMKVQAMGCAEDELERQMTDKYWPFQDFDEDE